MMKNNKEKNIGYVFKQFQKTTAKPDAIRLLGQKAVTPRSRATRKMLEEKAGREKKAGRAKLDRMVSAKSS